MTRGTMPFFAAMGALVLAVGLFLSFYMSSHAYSTEKTKIVLPKDAVTEGIASEANVNTEPSAFTMTSPEVNSDNVQKIIETLVRPAAYSAVVQNTLYWPGGKQTLSARQYVKDGFCKTEYTLSGSTQIRHTILSKDSFFSWKSGDASYYRGKRGAFSFDTVGMLPSYETILEWKKEEIRDAGVKNVGYSPCIYVTSEDSKNNLKFTYWVSTVTGLLVQADYYKGTTLVRQVVVNQITLGEPEDSYFLLPNNSYVFQQ